MAALGAARASDTDAAGGFLDDVLCGLAQPQKTIPPKYFYDTAGSLLFEQICELEEYYPTRTELGILAANAGEMAHLIGPGASLIEFGAGASRKVRLLLDALTAPAAFVPIDISGDHLLAAAAELRGDYPGLQVVPVVADYTKPLTLPREASEGRPIVFFPGSTIGNFTPDEAVQFLSRTARLVGRRGAMLIGVDTKKDERILNAAYNDRKGVTAAFNRNLLVRINRELGANFDVSAFRHRAFYNPGLGRIEMHLISTRPQSVRVGGRSFRFALGETIHTENSYKFSIPEFQAIAAAHGFAPERVWTDTQALFSVHLLRRED